MKPPVVVTVQWDHADPVYAQIARQIRAYIACGDLPAGTALPAVRALASDLGVNLNTVARAYLVLEDEGFIRIRDRSGAEVAGPSRMAGGGSRDRLQDELRDVLARLRQAGTDLTRLKRLVVREIAGMSGRRERTGEG